MLPILKRLSQGPLVLGMIHLSPLTTPHPGPRHFWAQKNELVQKPGFVVLLTFTERLPGPHTAEGRHQRVLTPQLGPGTGAGAWEVPG